MNKYLEKIAGWGNVIGNLTGRTAKEAARDAGSLIENVRNHAGWKSDAVTKVWVNRSFRDQGISLPMLERHRDLKSLRKFRATEKKSRKALDEAVKDFDTAKHQVKRTRQVVGGVAAAGVIGGGIYAAKKNKD